MGDLKDSIEKLRIKYPELKKKLKEYPFSSEKMYDQFIDIFEQIIEEKSSNQSYKLISTRGRMFLISNFLRRYFNISIYSNLIGSKIKKILKNEH